MPQIGLTFHCKQQSRFNELFANGIRFLHLALCNDIKQDAVRSEVSVVEAWEIILFSIVGAFLLRIKNSMVLMTKSEYFVLRCRISRDGFIASFPRTVAQMTN